MRSRSAQRGGPLAAAIALAAGSQAYAISFVATPANLASSNGSTITRAWDVDGNSTTDFVFTFRFPNTTGATGVVWQASMAPLIANGNGVVGYQGPFIPYATNLSYGQNVGPTPPAGASFRTTTQTVLASVYRSSGIPSGYGGFYPGTPNVGGTGAGASRGFAGFRIGTGATARHGWINLRVSSAGVEFYNAALGEVGEAVQASGAVPEPTSLAAIAIGAVVFLQARRHEVAR